MVTNDTSGVPCGAPVALPCSRARGEAEAGRESPVLPRRLQICFPLRRAMLEQGQMLQEPLINDGVVMSCERLQ